MCPSQRSIPAAAAALLLGLAGGAPAADLSSAGVIRKTTPDAKPVTLVSSGAQIVVDLTKVFHSDADQSHWQAAVVRLDGDPSSGHDSSNTMWA